MILDYELEFTTKDGQPITATAYGTKAIDFKAADDISVGEPVEAFFRVVGNDFNNLTSLDIAVVGDNDGAGAGEVTILTKNYLLADLTIAKGVRSLGRLPRGVAKKFGRGKFTVNGANPAQGKIEMWIGKGSDLARANAAGTI